MSEVHRFKFDQSVHKGKYTKLEQRMIEKLITKEYVIQLGDVFFFEETPLFIAVIVEEAPPSSWSDLKKHKVISTSQPLLNRGPEPEKMLHFVLNALEGSAFVKRDQVCYLVFTKKYGKEDAIEIQIGEYQNGKN